MKELSDFSLVFALLFLFLFLFQQLMSNSIWPYFRSDLIVLLIQCELAGQPRNESRMNHLHDSRLKTETPTVTEHRPISSQMQWQPQFKQKADTCRRVTAEIKPLGIHCFQPTNWTGG